MPCMTHADRRITELQSISTRGLRMRTDSILLFHRCLFLFFLLEGFVVIEEQQGDRWHHAQPNSAVYHDLKQSHTCVHFSQCNSVILSTDSRTKRRSNMVTSVSLYREVPCKHESQRSDLKCMLRPCIASR